MSYIIIGEPLPGITQSSLPYWAGPPALVNEQALVVNIYTNLIPQLDIDELWRTQVLNFLARGQTLVIILSQPLYFLPPSLQFEDAQGTDLKLNNHALLNEYWKKTLPYLHYTQEIVTPPQIPLAMIKSSSKLTAGLFKISRGNLLLLPAINWEHPDLINEDEYSPKLLELSKWLDNYFTTIHDQVRQLQ